MIAFLTSCTIFLIFVVIYLSVKLKQKQIKYDGQIVITELEDRKVFALELDGDPDDLVDQEFVAFKIKPTKPSIEEDSL